MLLPRTVLSLAAVADSSSSRFALGSIALERDAAGNPLAIATDGRKLLVLGWNEADTENYPVLDGIDRDARLAEGDTLLLPAAACKEANKVKLSKTVLKSKPILSNVLVDETMTEGQDIKIGQTDMSGGSVQSVRRVDGRFPHWRNCMPAVTPKSSVSVTLDARHLATLLDTISRHVNSDSSTPIVVLTIDLAEPATRPIHLSACDGRGHRACGVLMPAVGDLETIWTDAGDRISRHNGPAWSPVEHDATTLACAESKARKAQLAWIAHDTPGGVVESAVVESAEESETDTVTV